MNSPTPKNKLAKLYGQKTLIFHTQDLGTIWQITNKNTLYTTIKRMVKRGELYKIYKGMYSIQPPINLNPILLGLKALHTYAYLSTETVLSKAGIINQLSTQITLVSSKSVRFQINSNNYISRQLKDIYLYNPLGITEKDGIKTALPERAAADLLYFNPKAQIDNKQLLNRQKLTDIQKELGYI